MMIFAFSVAQFQVRCTMEAMHDVDCKDKVDAAGSVLPRQALYCRSRLCIAAAGSTLCHARRYLTL